MLQEQKAVGYLGVSWAARAQRRERDVFLNVCCPITGPLRMAVHEFHHIVNWKAGREIIGLSTILLRSLQMTQLLCFPGHLVCPQRTHYGDIDSNGRDDSS